MDGGVVEKCEIFLKYYKHLGIKTVFVLFLIIFMLSLFMGIKYEFISKNPTTDLQYQLNTFINTKNQTVKHISIYFYSFNNAQEIKINDNYKYYPASLEKVPIMITYLKYAQSDPMILQYPLSYSLKDSKPYTQNIVLSKDILSNKPYTIDELIKRMIETSDNKATNLLFDHINTTAITSVFTELGIKNCEINDINYSLSVSDYAIFFKILYKEDYLNKVMSQKALHYLMESKYKYGLVAGVPSSVPVAEKFGERIFYYPKKINQFHECGIIYYPNYPYLLCVMTDGNNIYQQANIVKEISLLVYNNVNQRNKNHF